MEKLQSASKRKNRGINQLGPDLPKLELQSSLPIPPSKMYWGNNDSTNSEKIQNTFLLIDTQTLFYSISLVDWVSF